MRTIEASSISGSCATVEAAETSEDTDRCYSEGDPEEPPVNQKEMMRLLKQEKDCVKRIQEAFSNYQTLRESFNAKCGAGVTRSLSPG